MKEIVAVVHVVPEVDENQQLRDGVMRMGWSALQDKYPEATNRHFHREVTPGYLTTTPPEQDIIEYQFYGEV